MEEIKVPQYLDDPPQFLIWEIDDLFPVIVMLILGILIEHMFLMSLIGFVLSYFFSKFKNSKPNGFLIHLAYEIGFLGVGKKGVWVDPFVKRWFP